MRDIDALLHFIAERERMPFAWGDRANDCVSYAAGAVRACTGRTGLLGGHRWTTAGGAARVLARLGGMEAAVCGALPPIAPAFAARGDVAGVADARLGMSLAIVEGDWLVGPGETGSMRVPRSAMIRAWSAE